MTLARAHNRDTVPLSQLMSFTIVNFFYILFTTVKAFYQRQIPSVTTANDNHAVFNLRIYTGTDTQIEKGGKVT